ncbi:hypothetical protein C8R44DRAFT_879800 [Mycena epipterygia]|nr:hypothetical protein C8R44DRAFT_879800 [Mycena epipterygia]
MTKDQLELGTLVIVVLKAKNLNDKYFWKQDVFAQVGLNGETKRTKVDVKGGQHPMWDEEIRIPVMKETAEKFRKLEVSCWAKEPKKEENIGQGSIDLSETLKTGEFDDWIPLEVNGVARGEIYLEITYYTNAPAPVGLAAPKVNLQRRPSKLSPSERLARPAYTPPNAAHPHRQQDYPQHGQPASGHLAASPPSSRTSSTSPSGIGRQSPLPPLPEQLSPNPPVPNTLTPGRPRPQGGAQGPQHVPSILRPRNPKSSPTPIPRPTSEYSGVVPPQGHGYASESPPRAYTPVVPPPDSTYDDASSYAPPPLDRWGSGSNDSPADFSFPVPSIAGAREPTLEYPPAPYPPGPAAYTGPGAPDRHGSGGSSYSSPPPPPSFQQQQPFQAQPPFQPPPPHSFQSPPPPAFQAPPPNFQPQGPPPAFQPPASSFQPPGPSFQSQAPAHRNGDLPDPYLLARYQSPLPLPPGSENHTRERRSSHTQAAPAPPQKEAAAPSKATPASTQSNPDNARLQALRQVEEDTARRRAQEEKDRERRRAQEERDREDARLQALRRVEEQAARRKTQEEKDRELARQLDRELNLGEAPGEGADMPGRW